MIVDSQREYNGPDMGSSGNAGRDLLSLRLYKIAKCTTNLNFVKIMGQSGSA